LPYATTFDEPSMATTDALVVDTTNPSVADRSIVEPSWNDTQLIVCAVLPSESRASANVNVATRLYALAPAARVSELLVNTSVDMVPIAAAVDDTVKSRPPTVRPPITTETRAVPTLTPVTKRVDVLTVATPVALLTSPPAIHWLTLRVVALFASYEKTAEAEMVVRWYFCMQLAPFSTVQFGMAFKVVTSADNVIGMAGVQTRKFSVAEKLPTVIVTGTAAPLLVSVPSRVTVVHAGEAILRTVGDPDEQVMPDVMVETVPARLIPLTVTALVTATPFKIAVFSNSVFGAYANRKTLAVLPMFTTPAVLSPFRSTARAAVGTVLPPGWMAAFKMLLKKLMVQLTLWTLFVGAVARTVTCNVTNN